LAKIKAPDLSYEKYTLKNGLDVILREDHRLPLVAVNVWYHVGPANERPGLTGFAHLFEHMMFQGSKHVGAENHFRQLEAAGASDINGTTDFDRTNYFETLPSNQLELALWLESDRMGFLLDMLDDAMLENQRDVVRNERRQSVENAPYGLVEEELFHQLFPKDHPYYASVIGSHADIEAARLKDVQEFFRLFYSPNNASLAIVGDIDKSKTRALVERYFGPIPAGLPIPKVDVKTPRIRSERRVTVSDQVELPRVYMAWITSPIFKPGDAETDLLAQILGGGKSSRLYKRLVYDKRIAQDVIAHQHSLNLGSVFYIQATAKPGITPEALEKEIDEELEAIRTAGPTDAELERARNTIESSLIRGLETLGGFGGVADRLNQYNHFLSDPGYLVRDLRRYTRATTGALRKVAQSKLAPKSRVVVCGVPGTKILQEVPRTGVIAQKPSPEKTAAAAPNGDWRNQQPASGPPSVLELPVPKMSRLPNGLTLYLVEQHALPVIAANLIVLKGSEANPPERPGLASFTAQMLDEGTRNKSALQIAADADQIGALLTTGSSADYSFVAVRSLKRNVDAAFELAADVALNADFPQNEIDRIRDDRLTSILQHHDNPNALASKVFFNVLYGTSHPYGHIELGTEESNRSITRDELVEFRTLGYVPENAALIVAGDLAENELQELAEKHFGSWRANGTVGEPPAATANSSRRIVIVDKPGSAQTSLLVGHVGIARSNPDYVPVNVMNTGLGGLFSSRINLNLREKNGYTYGASSAFVYRRGPGPFLVRTGVRTDVTAAAVQEILYEIERIRTSPVTTEELQRAQDAIARSLPALFETTSHSAASIGQLFVHGLEVDYYRALPAEVIAVTPAAVQRVAERYLRPEGLVVVAVGDRAQIEPQLTGLQFGPIEIRDLDGKPI
jgi:zinc protease